MPVLLSDETIRIADPTVEAAVAALLARNNKLNRSEALRLLMKRFTRKSTGGPRLEFTRGKNPSDAALAPAASGDA